MRKHLVVILLLLCVSTASPDDPLIHNRTLSITTSAGGSATSISKDVGITDIRKHYSSIKATFVVAASAVTARGFGLDDSCRISLVGRNYAGYVDTIASASRAALPCTLSYASVSTALDTLLMDEIFVWYFVTDTLADSVLTATYPFKYVVSLK